MEKNTETKRDVIQEAKDQIVKEKQDILVAELKGLFNTELKAKKVCANAVAARVKKEKEIKENGESFDIG